MNTTAPRIAPSARSGCERRNSTSRGGPKSWSSRSPPWPWRARRQQLVDLLLGEGVAVPAVPEPFGGVVAQELDAVGVHHDDRVRRRVQRLRELLALRGGRSGAFGGGVTPASRSAGHASAEAHPNRPVM